MCQSFAVSILGLGTPPHGSGTWNGASGPSTLGNLIRNENNKWHDYSDTDSLSTFLNLSPRSLSQLSRNRGPKPLFRLDLKPGPLVHPLYYSPPFQFPNLRTTTNPPDNPSPIHRNHLNPVKTPVSFGPSQPWTKPIIIIQFNTVVVGVGSVRVFLQFRSRDHEHLH